MARNVCEQFLTVIHSDWVTGKRGRRNSVGSLDSTIEVSLWGGGLCYQFVAALQQQTVLEILPVLMFYGILHPSH